MEKIEDGIKDIGNFEVKSNKVIVSDPCYELNTWCQGVVENVKNGDWMASIDVSDQGRWGSRVKALIAVQRDHEDVNGWEKQKFEVGVDSGQAGIFDADHYRDDSIVANMSDKDRKNDENICEDEPWYSWCCDRTLALPGAGVIPFGAVSSSGFGDGGYDCYIHKDKDGIVDGIKIIFIDDEDDRNDDDEDENEDDE